MSYIDDLTVELQDYFYPAEMLKKTIEPCKHNRKYNGFNGFNGNCIGFNGNYNGVYWYVMDSIGGMLHHIGKMHKTNYKIDFVMVLLEKANGA